MHTTRHFSQRMSQRGVTRDMVELVQDFGTLDGDRCVLGKRRAGQVIEELKRKLSVLKKIQDKGGLVVVEQGEALITTYNLDKPSHP
jgi:hypothetical protein